MMHQSAHQEGPVDELTSLQTMDWLNRALPTALEHWGFRLAEEDRLNDALQLESAAKPAPKSLLRFPRPTDPGANEAADPTNAPARHFATPVPFLTGAAIPVPSTLDRFRCNPALSDSEPAPPDLQTPHARGP